MELASSKLLLPNLTEPVIGAAMEVANVLGGGFLEKVYERALTFELRDRGHQVDVQPNFPVIYKGHLAGEYSADLLVDRELILELRCVDHFSPEHTSQCMNYLKATGLKVALLLNFQRAKLEWKRVVL